MCIRNDFDEEPDALAHATFLFNDYINSGWTDVVQLDSRIQRPHTQSDAG